MEVERNMCLSSGSRHGAQQLLAGLLPAPVCHYFSSPKTWHGKECIRYPVVRSHTWEARRWPEYTRKASRISETYRMDSSVFSNQSNWRWSWLFFVTPPLFFLEGKLAGDTLCATAFSHCQEAAQEAWSCEVGSTLHF